MADQFLKCYISLECYIVDKKIYELSENTVNKHYHPYYEVYYFMGDKMTFFLDNTVLSLEKNDIILVDKLIYHKTFYDLNLDCTRMNIAFDNAFLDEFNLSELQKNKILCPFHQINRLRFKDQNTRSYFHNLLFSVHKHTLSNQFGKVALLTFLNEISDRIADSEPLTERDLISGTNVVVSQIIDYINTNYHDKIDLELLSDKFHISKYHLCRIFKQVAGMGFSSFVITKRLKEAELLIKNTDKTIIDICEECGFGSMSNFIYQFEKCYHLSPKEFRNK